VNILPRAVRHSLGGAFLRADLFSGIREIAVDKPKRLEYIDFSETELEKKRDEPRRNTMTDRQFARAHDQYLDPDRHEFLNGEDESDAPEPTEWQDDPASFAPATDYPILAQALDADEADTLAFWEANRVRRAASDARFRERGEAAIVAARG
jgi:hypothetical protein